MVTSASNWSICVITLQFRFATKLSSSERQAYNIPVRYAADPAAAAKVTDSPPPPAESHARSDSRMQCTNEYANRNEWGSYSELLDLQSDRPEAVAKLSWERTHQVDFNLICLQFGI